MLSPSRRRNRDRFVMGTLGKSVFAGRPAVFRCSAGAFLRSWLSPLSHSKLNNVDPESQETQIQSSEMNMVRVLFQLRKACVFGQHFFVVGDDPVLGGWDTERAISLVWSDGHLWSAEMSLPVGKTILFKFILKGSRGEVAWQPGPDRTIKTWEAKNTIVISEDWDNAELQKINEEVLFEQTGNKTTVPSLLTEDEVDVAETEEVITLEEDEGSIIMNEHQPVLVPGLISASSSIVEETIVDVEDIKFVPPVTSDEAIEGITFKVDPESQETQIQSSEMNMVRVIFQLRKACVFGQHFFLVGDDPVLGGWDTERAISLVWSDGHLWSAEMSLPVGKIILFKFILKGCRGEVAWQLGPDRTIKTWEAKNSIVISEDWDNAELQKINEEVLFEQTGNKTTVPSLLTEDEVDVAETEEVITLEEDEGSIIMNEHQPVLVPGLISASSSIVEETIVDVEDIKFVPPVTSDEAIEGITFKKEEELLDESEKSIDPLHIVKPDEGSGESAVNMASEASEEDQATEEAPVTDDVFKNDIQWGYKSLLRFILNLVVQNNR